MDIAAFIPLLTAILEAAPQVVAEIEAVWNMLTQQTAPTADQQAQIDAALKAAHEALQQS